MKIINCVLNRADGVEEISVVRSSVLGADSGWLSCDELLSFQILDVLRNGVSAHSNSTTDGAVARIALEGFSILAVHQIGIDSDLTEG